MYNMLIEGALDITFLTDLSFFLVVPRLDIKCDTVYSLYLQTCLKYSLVH